MPEAGSFDGTPEHVFLLEENPTRFHLIAMNTRYLSAIHPVVSLYLGFSSLAGAVELHVSPNGSDSNAGTQTAMLRTISEAGRRAQPGDTVTVHEGIYRESVNPPRGGTSDTMRIVYQAAPGENVVIKGSEVVTGWQHVGNDTWKVVLPSSSFGNFNPYNNLISGDWFTSNGRNHHTGAVYLNGHWLTEAATKTEALNAVGGNPLWFAEVEGGGALLNVAWFQPYAGATAGARFDASWFDRDLGVTIAPCSEGSECVGWIDDGEWTRYNNVDFGTNADSVKIRAASATTGGVIEVRLDRPDGSLLGSVAVPNTGGWQTWNTFTATITPTSGVHHVYLVYRAPNYATAKTTIWAQFPGKNPNQELVEINARQSVFYPEEPGLKYITVRGFILEQAATPWAPPTAEQIAVIGTNWGKGWVIENNTIRYSTCSGISLGKYGDRWDNTATTSANSANAYVETIQRALAKDWNKANVGGHLVRNNHISYCEQAGIVGSLGGVFSTITGNHIHDVHVRRLFTGAEMSGIKLHGSIDTQLTHNHIHHSVRGIWLDWMAQGTRVSSSLFHDNNATEDLFLEVDHGPILIDHNIFLSSSSVWDSSQGEAYAHNIFAGTIRFTPDRNRDTPYHPAHSTTIAGLAKVEGGDTRFFNNILVGPASLAGYNSTTYPVSMAGNVFLKGATASTRETSPLMLPNYDPALKLRAAEKGYFFEMNTDPSWGTVRARSVVTTTLLGKAVVPNVPFEQPDGSPWLLNSDIFGREHASSPFPGPFATPQAGVNTWKVSAAPTKRSGLSKVMERIHLDINGGQTPGTAGDFSGTPASVLGIAGETWNHVTPGSKASGSASLKNSSGQATTVGITWTPNYYSYDNSTPASNYRDLLGDYAYLHSSGPSSSTWTFTGLAPYSTYNLVIYAATGTSGGKWIVNGVTKEATPTASAASLNEGQEYVRFENARANGYGEIPIVFAIRSGQSYGEMAAIEIETVALANTAPMKVSQSRHNNGVFEVTADGLDPAGRYVLTRSFDLEDDFPEVIGGAFSPTGSTITLSDPFPPAIQAFYRIEEIP